MKISAGLKNVPQIRLSPDFLIRPAWRRPTFPPRGKACALPRHSHIRTQYPSADSGGVQLIKLCRQCGSTNWNWQLLPVSFSVFSLYFRIFLRFSGNGRQDKSYKAEAAQTQQNTTNTNNQWNCLVNGRIVVI